MGYRTLLLLLENDYDKLRCRKILAKDMNIGARKRRVSEREKKMISRLQVIWINPSWTRTSRVEAWMIASDYESTLSSSKKKRFDLLLRLHITPHTAFDFHYSKRCKNNFALMTCHDCLTYSIIHLLFCFFSLGKYIFILLSWFWFEGKRKVSFLFFLLLPSITRDDESK